MSNFENNWDKEVTQFEFGSRENLQAIILSGGDFEIHVRRTTFRNADFRFQRKLDII